MKTVGLITEYNPFHNGHKYHIEAAKALAGADYVVVIMSGDFVQRGEPALIPKHLRAEMALKAGADLVIELPLTFATASAERFAFGAVSALHKLGVIDFLCFGSEAGQITPLQEIARTLNEEPILYREALQENLALGQRFPLAREHALSTYYQGQPELVKHLKEPNNILGIEYLKALLKLGSSITPLTTRRQESGYHDLTLATTYSSATALRALLNDQGLTFGFLSQVPEEITMLYQDNYKRRFPVYPDDFSLLLRAALLKTSRDELATYADIGLELANTIYRQRNHFRSFSDFADLLTTKNYTRTRIMRGLLHLLLDIRKGDQETEPPSFLRVLGFNRNAQELLKEIKKKGKVSLLTKIGDTLPKKEIYASNLYESVVSDKFSVPYLEEHEKSLVFIK
ncbi:cytidyltransferase-like protein [Lachnospiraceae bacterium PF1-21]|uniref:tRNA(Met) cytidine acetate ligase n=1 Tax=Ohessyouella blattaphilus TaxID=2949333 RepID=A0ABT1EEQ5_9FIRM|nr:nucleotidyltransferase [Ohessyouella blattaphilus]MCP1109165.1 nucleotidyltransferase [Ohessyouella blattaphilus]MCR8562559.1 nucleotidyltransferase [Ohessyouella blattaphilus]